MRGISRCRTVSNSPTYSERWAKAHWVGYAIVIVIVIVEIATYGALPPASLSLSLLSCPRTHAAFHSQSPADISVANLAMNQYNDPSVFFDGKVLLNISPTPNERYEIQL